MKISDSIMRLLGRGPVTEQGLRSRAEAKLAEDQLRNLKISQIGAGSSTGPGGGQVDIPRRGGRF